MTVKELIAKFEYAANNPNALLDGYLVEVMEERKNDGGAQ